MLAFKYRLKSTSDQVTCFICGGKYKELTWAHLRKHRITVAEYREKYPNISISSEETIKKRSKTPPEYVLKLAHEKAAERNRGRPRPLEVKKKISETRKKRKERVGYLNSPETRELFRQFRLGMKLPEEWKENIRDGVRQFYEQNPEKRADKSKEMKDILDKSPNITEKSASRLKQIWGRDRENMLIKMRSGKKNHTLGHIEEILKSFQEYQEKGYRCIPIDHMVAKVLPDFIAIKDGEVLAVEVEFGNTAKPKPQKYEGIDYYDKVIWVVIKEG